MTDPGPGQTMFAFVRYWARRAADDQQGRLVLVTETVHALTRHREPATVNAIAHEIGIDQSGASRLVRSAVDAGYLTMSASAADARQRHATVTASGRKLLDHAHDWQEQTFGTLTEGWSTRRRAEFHRAMTDLIDRSRRGDA